MLTALERPNWNIAGAGRATDLPGVKPAVLAFGINAMGLTRGNPFRVRGICICKTFRVFCPY